MSRKLASFSLFVVLLSVLALPSLASAQGVFINIHPDEHVRLPRPITSPRPLPSPPATYKIGEIEVQAKIVDQVAQVNLTQSIVNTGSATLEACFAFPLPYDGAIDRLTLLVDGKEFPARLLPKDEARRIYESIVRKNRDPALLEWIGQGMFQTSVFPIPAGATRKVTLHYSQLCRRSGGLVDFLLPLATARYTSAPLERLSVNLTIESKDELKNVYSPTHGVELQRDAHRATVRYTARDTVPTSDFRLFYDVGRERFGANVVTYRPQSSDEGYFLVLASPEVRRREQAPLPKTVIFVVDRSGSMSGKKIEQAKGALKFMLNNLQPGDVFNIVSYESSVESFRPEVQRYDEQTRQASLSYVEGLYAGGGTNIDGALKAALAQLQDNKRPSYVLFLTDGLPTVGEQNESKIVARSREVNAVHARLITLGVGYDVNSRLLDKLARENSGHSEYVRPDEDLEVHVSRLYDRFKSPMLTDMRIEFALDEASSSGSFVNRMYPKQVHDLFAGDQLVLVGRYRRHGAAKITISGKVGDESPKFSFPAQFVEKSNDETFAFVEKLWATRRVGEIIDELDLRGRNEELVRELVELATRHGIMTPYTSFLADENTRLGDLTSNTREADRRLLRLQETTGLSALEQRAAKYAFQNAGAPGQGGAAASTSPTAANAPADGLVRFKDAEGRDKVAETVRQVGQRAFYRRQGIWIDATLTEAQQKAPQRIKQFSDEYFTLLKRISASDATYLALDEPAMVNVAGGAVVIEP